MTIPDNWPVGLMGLLMIAACVYILFFRKDQFDAYAARRCECDKAGGSFTPNHLDDRCGVCRGIEPLLMAAVPEESVKLRTGPECDFGCGSKEYTDDNPFVKICQQRPSDHTDMCCVMWGHANCAGAPVGSLPSISSSGGVATPEQWDNWIESPEARKMGFVFIT